MQPAFIIIFALIFLSTVLCVFIFREYKRDYLKTIDSQRLSLRFVLGFSALCTDMLHRLDFIKRTGVYNKSKKRLAALNTGESPEKSIYIHHLQLISYTVVVVLVVSFLGLAYTATLSDADKSSVLNVTRPDNGDGSQSISLVTDSELYSGPIDITIEDRKYTFDEAMEIFSAVRADFDAYVLNENISFLQVDSALRLPSSWGDDNISVSWYISSPDIIDYTGSINEENVVSTGVSLEIIATMTLNEISADICYQLTVFPPKVTGKEKIISYLNKYINSDKNSTKDVVSLPDNILGFDISYSTDAEVYPPWIFAVIIVVLPILIIALEKRSIEKKLVERNEEILSDYPELVSKFSLLTLTGLSISNALFRITEDYYSSLEDGNKKRFVYEEIAITCKRLANGIYEPIAYEEMGQRLGIPCYIKFSSFLISGLKRGTADFNRLISEEATTALLEQKAAILQKGEQASSKLIGPMMLMFIVILVLIMLPALSSINI